MTDWFRQTEWNEATEAAFFARLGRSRDKGQYLNIQAYTLLASHPDVAAKLCRHAIMLEAPGQSARAGLYLGTALAVSGDVDGAIEALEHAIAAERADPMFATGAHLDQALLVAVHKRSDLFHQVRERLADQHALPLGEQPLTAQISLALIGAELGEEVGEVADAAFMALSEYEPHDSELPGHLDVEAIRIRLAELSKR